MCMIFSKPRQKSKKTELSLSGLGLAIDYAELTKSDAKKVIANGTSEERFNELVGDGPRESGPTDISWLSFVWLRSSGRAQANAPGTFSF